MSTNNSIECCEWHDSLPDMLDEDTPPEDNRIFGEAPECGLAGMGTPSVCCRDCPQSPRYNKPYFIKEIMALPIEERP